MRLIDADALCRHLSDWQFGSMMDGKHNAEYEVINKVIDGIEQEPTVDAVAVVRCKDCRHRDPEDHKCDSGEMERQGCPFKVADDYFCAYGEKGEANDTRRSKIYS